MFENRGKSIFAQLDQECKFTRNTPEESDTKLLNSYKTHLKDYNTFSQGSLKRRNKEFGVNHYAGKVMYNITMFCEKNKSAANKELIKILAESKNGQLKDIFNEELALSNNKQVDSVATAYQKQMADLMKHLASTSPQYIRCIKPNTKQMPDEFDAPEVCRQLRCAGMLEAIRIRKSGFPVRRTYDAFTKQYKNLMAQHGATKGSGKEKCKDFVDTIYEKGIFDKTLKEIQLGRTKIFMKETTKSVQDQLQEKSIEEFAIRIQKNVRGYLARKRYKELRKYTQYQQGLARKKATQRKIKRKAKERVAREHEPALMITRNVRKFLFKKHLFQKLREQIFQKQMELENEVVEPPVPEKNPQLEKIKEMLKDFKNAESQHKESVYIF